MLLFILSLVTGAVIIMLGIVFWASYTRRDTQETDSRDTQETAWRERQYTEWRDKATASLGWGPKNPP